MKQPDSPAQAYGLIAGWGRFPIQVAEAIRENGDAVHCVAVKGHALPEIESVCDSTQWFGVGRMGSHVRYFRRHGVTAVTMAGKLFKSEILYGGSLLGHCPDWTCVRAFAPLLLGRNRDARDDSLLTAVTEIYLRSKIDVCPATDLAPELLVKEGHLAGPRPKPAAKRDADIGWRTAKQMGGMDIGQSVTIKDGTVIAIEAIEGTDACIERTGQLCSRGGWTLVKVAKPNQDMRFDVPTIGPQTVQRVHEAGGTSIVIEADKTIVVDQTETFAAAHKAGISILAFCDSNMGQDSKMNQRSRTVAA